MSTLITQHPEQSPDDDPTGVRDLLSSLPQPDPMPDYLVERINASLTAEQALRATTSPEAAAAAVTPLLAPTRRRSGRLLFAIAGTAAAVALVAVVGNNVLKANQSPVGGSAVAASTPSAQKSPQAALSDSTNQKPAAGNAYTPPIVQIGLSGTRYTKADFVTQARILRAREPIRPLAAARSDVGPVGTTPGLIDCLGAIGAGGAQLVRADLAFYDGRPAVVIVATTNGIPMAYAVGRQCSHADAALLRPATPLP